MMHSMANSAPHGKGRFHAERQNAICCDVLDAWFDPSPKAISAFLASGQVMRTSPETDGQGLIDSIGKARSLDPECVTLGAGSSEIIYRILPTLMGKGPAVVLDPTYSEYPFLFERDGIKVRRHRLHEGNEFAVRLDALAQDCADASIVILVNPNNPTGKAVSRRQILDLRERLPMGTNLWIDEAYVDYCPVGASVEKDACQIPGLYLLKSLSKAYALSGVRAAYLVCTPDQTSEFRLGTPPWIIGTSAQAAAAAAVQDKAYYEARWTESGSMLRTFACSLQSLDLKVHFGYINAVLVEVPSGKSAFEWASELATNGLVVRTSEGMGEVLGDRFIRIGLPDPSLQQKVIDVVAMTLKSF